ncbi:uncharacterized protein LOC133795903 [Humulus lupulus]|uniref:uncharacterized protein LOC133795903 n=1 Tax=Humulus lupulus TaxID=3486 RepID=UPI002B41669E|nr:uncharacterized protein LOC133795903 [Humulus lupulus]
MTTSVLDFMGVESNDRVAYSTFMFREDAQIWWEVVSQTRDVKTLSWEEFRGLFNEKYYNDAVRATKANGFSNLLHGTMTIIEYALKFDMLAKLAVDLVPTDVVEKALTAENKIWCENVARRDTRWVGPPFIGASCGGSSDQKRKILVTIIVPGPDRRTWGAQVGRQGSNESWRTYPECARCRRRHLRECRAKACFLCDIVEHLKKYFPGSKKEELKKADNLALARVFALTQSKVEARPSVVTCQLSSVGTSYSVLIDFGATYSFVSSRAIDRLCRPWEYDVVGFGPCFL